MGNSSPVVAGAEVTLHYRLLLEDGTEVDSTFGGEPFTFTVGDGSLESGLERLLEGLSPGDRMKQDLAPGQAFGSADPSKVHLLHANQFAPDMLMPGHVIEFTLPNGETVAGRIMEIIGEQVLVDFNHPLAGQAFSFEVEILAVEPPTQS